MLGEKQEQEPHLRVCEGQRPETQVRRSVGHGAEHELDRFDGLHRGERIKREGCACAPLKLQPTW